VTIVAARLLTDDLVVVMTAGLAAIVGHIYSVWIGFRGGKGVAASAGVFAMLAPSATAIAVIVFLATVFVTRSSPRARSPERLRLRSRRLPATRLAPSSSAHSQRPCLSSIAIEQTSCALQRDRTADWIAAVIAVLGAGGWGSALAVHLVRTGHDAWLWGRDAALVAELRARRANAVYLPDITFPSRLNVTADLSEAVGGAEVVVVAVPSHGMRDVLHRAAPLVSREAMVVSAAKGLERDTLFRPSEIVLQEFGPHVRVGVLSGPSFASEMARELPTAVCIASTDSRVVDKVQAGFRAPYFRLYGTTMSSASRSAAP
jgi:hypothetical protein